MRARTVNKKSNDNNRTRQQAVGGGNKRYILKQYNLRQRKCFDVNAELPPDVERNR